MHEHHAMQGTAEGGNEPRPLLENKELQTPVLLGWYRMVSEKFEVRTVSWPRGGLPLGREEGKHGEGLRPHRVAGEERGG